MTHRELWDRGDPTLGGWCVIPSPFTADLMRRAGHDWLASSAAPPEAAIGWREAGFRMLSVDHDAVLIRTRAAQVREAMRGTKREVSRTGC